MPDAIEFILEEPLKRHLVALSSMDTLITERGWHDERAHGLSEL